MIDRTEGYFLFPEKDYEMVGEVNNVCFVEGLVFYKNKWFLYYGTGDSKIAVAVSESRSITEQVAICRTASNFRINFNHENKISRIRHQQHRCL